MTLSDWRKRQARIHAAQLKEEEEKKLAEKKKKATKGKKPENRVNLVVEEPAAPADEKVEEPVKLFDEEN